MRADGKYTDEVQQFEKDKIKIYGIIIGNISPASKQLIKAEPDWTTKNVEATNDPLDLVRCIVKSHLSENTGSNELDQMLAEREYSTFVQGEHENLSNYRRRLETLVARMQAIGCQYAPPASRQVTTFAMGLRGPYAAYATEFQNLTVSGAPTKPTTLADVERAAMYFKPRTDAIAPRRRAADPGASFFTVEDMRAAIRDELDKGESGGMKNIAAHANGGGGGKPKGGKGKQKGKAKSGSKPNKHVRFSEGEDADDHDVSDRLPSKRSKADTKDGCHICSKPGHYANDCPYKPKLLELIEDGVLTTYVTLNLAFTSSAAPLGPYDVLLDSQSNTNAFKT